MSETPQNADKRDYEVKELSGQDLTATVVSACIDVIRKGEAVDWQSAARELPVATSVVIAYKGTQIVGVGAIKRERRQYAARVSKQSGVEFPPETLELGYVAVDPNHQGHGLSHRIAGTLLSLHKDRLFATTYSERMKATLTKAGFVQKGRYWKGRRYTLSFWDKE